MVTRIAFHHSRAFKASLGSLLLLPFLAAAGAVEDVRRDATVRAIEKVMPSVVNIRTETVVAYRDPLEALFHEYFGPYHRQQRNQFSLGSGVIIDEEGYVLTNLHVVRRASRVWVVLWDGRTYEAETRFFGMARNDVAVLKIKAPPGETFQPISFSSSDEVHLGETVLALGNPFGLGGSVSRGIISSKRRIDPREHEELGIANWLQTDASINPGNSGGPLVNLQGDLVGINVAVLRGAQGIGFAIPVEQVREAVSEIFIPELFSARWFGARVRIGPPPLVVTVVQPESPAAKAGLQAGDLIIDINGRRPASLMGWSELLGGGSSLGFTMTVERDGERRTLSGTLVSFQELIRERLGLELQELSPELAAGLGLSPQDGLLIAGVDPGGPGARARLQPGHVVASLNGERVMNLLSVANQISRAGPGNMARLELQIPQFRGTTLAGYRRAAVQLEMR